jgi:flagellar biosynthesis/type III secretory pathway protein FliH
MAATLATPRVFDGFLGAAERAFYYGHSFCGNPLGDGYERGSREGAKQGYEDARKGRRFDFVRDRDFRDSDDGYKHWMGSRRAYESAFRRGFADAYRRGFEEGRRDRRGRGDRRDRW